MRNRVRSGWVRLTGMGAAASVAFGLLVFVSVLASLAIPRESAGLRTAALQREIAASHPVDRTVIGTSSATSMMNGANTFPAADLARAGASVRARLAANGVPVASDPPAWIGLTTGDVAVTGAAQPPGDGRPRFEMIYRTELARYGRLAAGRLPDGGPVPGAGAVVPTAVTTATAARFGLRVGSHVSAGPLQLMITGIIRPASPAAAFWTQQPLAARPLQTPPGPGHRPYWNGAVFVGPGELPFLESQLNTDQMEATWAYPVALGRLTAGQAGGLNARVGSLVSSGITLIDHSTQSPLPVTIVSQIPAILAPFIGGERAVAPVLELMYVSLAVMGAVVVLLGARLVAQRRAAEFTLMRARGAALYQLGWLVLRASLVIAVAAGAAAAVLAIGLTPGDGDAVSWWLAGLTLAVTLVGPVLVSVVPQRVAAPLTGRAEGGVRRAGGPRPAARRIVIEVVLVAAAIGGLVVLRDQGLSSGGRGLYTSAAPVLVAIPVAVVVLRCYPPLARELARIAGRSRGVVAFVGLARATRTPPGTVLPSFALVLVLAMVAFPDLVSTSVARSQVAASWQQVSADAIIQAPSGDVITPALQRQISSVPGVVSTATAVIDAGSLPAGFEMPVLFTNPARYAAVVDQGPGAPFPLAALSGHGARGQPAGIIPVVATSTAAPLVGRAPTTLSVVGTGNFKIRLAGRTGRVPGSAEGTAIVLPLRVLGPQAPAPQLMLVAGPGLDAARLTAAVRRALPGASVTLRASALAALTSAPVLQAAQTALVQGTLTAAGFGALVLLLLLLLSARTREMTLVRLATLGLRRWQAQLLLATETLPPVMAAAIGGVACAALLAPLVGPSLNLAAFSGTRSAILVTPAALPLAVAAVGLVLAALLFLAVQAVITYHRGSTRALRIAD